MIDPKTIQPLGDRCLVQLEKGEKSGLIYLGSERPLSAARGGKCLRSEQHTNQTVLVAHGGIPLNDDESLVLVPEKNLIRIDGVLQDPYIQITPEEVRMASLIDLPEIFFSGWYRVVDVFPGCEVSVDQRVLPIYGEPRLDMEDDSEYCSISAVGVVEC